ncbi:hypothetical protein J0J36_10295 (plasmid) [Lactococcus sp. LG1074]|uniref:hypothetical protein n=1 Tax=Lactococcus TaxID=1357 RepID=UPI001A8F8381|nr:MULTISPECIES: hypothetical protein [Lactococcus]QSR03110.1 hypothetical protein J0J36_10295 [Lactococcus sp. LG1074]QUW40328.1 hypothetical protein [Lactococcus garvieae]
MENTHTTSKSFKLNTFWLNLLILIRELYQAYYRVFIPAALLSLLLPLLKSSPQFIKEIRSIESLLLPFSFIFLILIVTFKMTNGHFLRENIFKNSLNFVIRHRRKLILLLFVGGFHGLSELTTYLSGKNFNELYTSIVVAALALFLLDYFILELKDSISDDVFNKSHVFNSDQPLLALTSLGKEKISVLSLQKQYGLPNQVMHGKIELHLKGVLTPVRRPFIRLSNSEEELLNSSYTHFLFKLHKIIQFFCAAALTLKGKSLKQVKDVYFEKQKTMSPKQKTGYTFIINISVILAFFILKVWLTK